MQGLRRGRDGSGIQRLVGFVGFWLCAGFHVPLFHYDFLEGFLACRRDDLVDGGEGLILVVDGDLLDGFWRRRGGFGEIERGDLEAVEEEAGAFGVEAATGNALQDESDAGLDGGTVFGQGQLEGGEDVAVSGRRFWAAGGVVVVAEVLVAERFAAAAVSVGEDVAALEVLDFGVWHGWGPSPP